MPHSFSNNPDDAIDSLENDLLKRGPFVARLAGILKSAPVKSSSVFSLYGEWGSGKTSIKNLVVKSLSDEQQDQAAPLVVEFNPWAFSSQAELFQSFFSEVAKVLGRKNAGDVAVAFSRLGGYLSIGAKAAKAVQVMTDFALLPGGGVAGLIADTLEKGGTQAQEYGDLLKKGEVKSLEDVRGELRAALEQLPKSILIVIDDIDRLPPDQILQMFQVVRVNASLPKINFLLLMDRESVADSLKVKGFKPDFLEKIVQFSINLPWIAHSDLREVLKKGLAEIAGPQASQIDWERWERIHKMALCHLLDTPRKLRRVLHTFRFHLTIFTQDGVPEVNLTDLFCLEVLRLYSPEFWTKIPGLHEQIFGYGDINWYLQNKDEKGERMKAVDAAIASAPSETQSACRELVLCLFPQLKKEPQDYTEVEWLADCRVCTSIHFDSYFLLTTNAAYPTQSEIQTLKAKVSEFVPFLDLTRGFSSTYGFANFLTKTHASFSTYSDASSIKHLIAAIWRLDEEDAAIDPVGGDWDSRESTISFSSYFLSRITDETLLIQIAREALDLSKAVYPLSALTHRALYLLKKGESRRQTLSISKENLIALQTICLGALTALRVAEKLICHPNLAMLLSFWEENDSQGALKWVADQMSDDARLLLILKSQISRTISTGSSGSTTTYRIPRASMKRLFDLKDPAFRSRLEQIDTVSLDSWDALALKEAFRNLDDEARGTEEVRFSN